MLASLICHLLWLSVAPGLALSPQPAAPPKPVLARVEAVAVSGAVRPGESATLVVRVTPRPGIHIYAEDEKQYKPIVLTLETSGAVRAGKASFPPAKWSTFGGERVRVYEDAFEIRQPVRLSAEAGATVAVRGTLEYQACDDLMCYLPVKVPLGWNVTVR
jgi:DsbC/DsbD-like thiol-disulfide interchange protein